MKTEKMNYTELSYFLGRNGTFKQDGISITQYYDNQTIYIEPITSKNQIGRAFITIPKENLSKFIKMLQKFKETD